MAEYKGPKPTKKEPRDINAMVARLGRFRLREREGLVWPEGTMTYGLRVLRSGELVESEADAVRYFRDELRWDVSALNGDEFGEEVVRQILSRAIFDPDPDRRKATPYPSLVEPEFLRDECYQDEVAAVWAEYVALKELSDPEDPELSEEEMVRIIEAVKKKDGTLLRQCAASTLRSFAITMVAQLSSYLDGKSASSDSSSESTD